MLKTGAVSSDPIIFNLLYYHTTLPGNGMAEKGYSFGTFQGVFVPSILTILGGIRGIFPAVTGIEAGHSDYINYSDLQFSYTLPRR